MPDDFMGFLMGFLVVGLFGYLVGALCGISAGLRDGADEAVSDSPRAVWKQMLIMARARKEAKEIKG